MKNTTPATTLNFHFAECSHFLKTLQVDLCDIRRQLSVQDHHHDQKLFTFDETHIDALVKSICSQASMPDLALLIGKRVRFGFSHLDAIPAYFQLDLKACLWALSRYLSDAFPRAVIEYVEHDEVVGLRLIRWPYSAPNQQFCIDALAAMLHSFLQFLMGDQAQPDYIAFNNPQPFRSAHYNGHFQCPLHFDSPQFEFAVSRNMAGSPIMLRRNHEASFSHHCSVGSLFPLQLYPLSQQIHRVIEQSPGNIPSEGRVAENLQISARTLRRKLFQFNSTFQKEVDYFRRNLAFHYLLSQDTDITNVAFMLGFSDSSAFSKAFRKWSGVSPREFKKSFSVKN